jgi:hypothetical protein
VTWDHVPAAQGLAAVLKAALDPDVAVFDHPPRSLNAPAAVVGRPLEVRYSVAALSIDEADVPVVGVHGFDRDVELAELLVQIRAAVEGDFTLGGAVQRATPSLQRNWRQATVSGVPLLAADLVVTITM